MATDTKMENLKNVDIEIYDAIKKEEERENNKILLIASENYASKSVMEAQGSVFTNKYAEGYPKRRYYGGCQYADIVENLAIERARQIFNADHINVQPHSGSQANMAVYFSVLKPGDTIFGMKLSHGGHLSHGASVNFTGKFFKSVSYGVNKETNYIDMDEVESLAFQYKPNMIVAGASAYSRIIDFEAFGKIAKKVGAYFLADIAHIAGLIAGGQHPSPVPFADFITSSTHKTLRGPRGGIIMCKSEYGNLIDKSIFPGIQGGPLVHVIAAKAVAFKEALSQEFKKYQQDIITNAKTLAEGLMNRGFKIISDGTDNHLMLVDLTSKNISGKEAEDMLDLAGITVNKNSIPFDQTPPTITSGIRIGTPSVTTRGMGKEEMGIIAEFIATLINNKDNISVINQVKEKIKSLCRKYPV